MFLGLPASPTFGDADGVQRAACLSDTLVPRASSPARHVPIALEHTARGVAIALSRVMQQHPTPIAIFDENRLPICGFDPSFTWCRPGGGMPLTVAIAAFVTRLATALRFHAHDVVVMYTLIERMIMHDARFAICSGMRWLMITCSLVTLKVVYDETTNITDFCKVLDDNKVATVASEHILRMEVRAHALVTCPIIARRASCVLTPRCCTHGRSACCGRWTGSCRRASCTTFTHRRCWRWLTTCTLVVTFVRSCFHATNLFGRRRSSSVHFVSIVTRHELAASNPSVTSV